MRDVFWIVPGELGGRAGPDLVPWQPDELRRGGIRAIVTVNDGELVSPDELAANGIHHGQFTMPDRAPPGPGDHERCRAALPPAYGFVCEQLAAGRPTVVHCRSGKDRTGLLLSYYLCMTQQLSPRAAIEEVRRHRPIALNAPGWEELAHDVLKAVLSGGT